MSLPPGSRVGVYEILSPLGEGGMGAVYRARDTRLDRHVAVKILLDSFVGDADRLARFEREARLLASLNHPRIAQVYGLEDSPSSGPEYAGVCALVMELVEGPTLADRIAQGALPVDEALAIARQIAEALEAAHNQGIIHRDLKPANIKLRADGSVKVLDFGLAKLADSTSRATAASGASALTSPGMTQAGVVLGTPAYMSPEQARGQSVDARADLWAFGCVCYEMLVGRRAFDGETATDAIAAVLTRDPDWNALPEHTPAALRRLLRRCVTRDLSRRLLHAGAVRLDLEEIASTPAAEERPSSRPSRHASVQRLPWAIAAIAVLAAVSLGWRAWSAPASSTMPPAPTTRLELTLPPGLEFFPSTSRTIFASADGRSIGFVGMSSGNRQVFVRRLDEFDVMPVRGTLGAAHASFSPDGQALVFVTAGGELKTVSLADGLVTNVATDASLMNGVMWLPDDVIVFTRRGTLWAVPRTGGEPRQLATLAENERTHGWPTALPDGRSVIFTAETNSGPQIEALTLADGRREVVLKQATRAWVGPEGHLFFYRDNRLLTVAFDAATRQVIGAPTLVFDKPPDLGGGVPVLDVSPAGLMVFPPASPQRHLVWVSRQGVEEQLTDAPNAYSSPRVSPDGARIAVDAGGIFVIDLRRKAMQRVITQSVTSNSFPMWMPDSTTIMHRSYLGLRLQNTESFAEARTLPNSTEFDYPGSMTPDGKTIIFYRSSPATSLDVLIAPVEDPGRATPLVQTAAYEAGARLSSDGRWIVYVSNESGRNEIYVRAFSGPERRRQVSTEGGSQPMWHPNGQEIFYRIGDRMMSVAVTHVGDQLQLSAPRELFARPYAYGPGITIANYDVTKDGRFVMVRDDATVGRLRVITNWRLDATAPAK